MEITKIQRSEVSHEILINETVHLSCHDSHPSPASPSLPVLCQFCVNQFSSKVEIYDSKNQSQAPLYEFPLRTSQIIPLMSPSSFFIVSNGQNFEVICPNSSIARKILRIIESLTDRHHSHETIQDTPLTETETPAIPTRTGQRLLTKHADLHKKENLIQNHQRVEPSSRNTLSSGGEMTKPSTSSNQLSSQHSGESKQATVATRSRRGISSLVHSYSNHYLGSHDASNRNDDEERSQQGRDHRNVDSSVIVDESLSSDSSSSDEDINTEDFHDHFFPNHSAAPFSAADSLMTYFQQNSDRSVDQVPELLSSSSRSRNLQDPQPSYLRSTRSSNRKVQSSTEFTETISSEKSEPKSTPAQRFHPFKNYPPNKKKSLTEETSLKGRQKKTQVNTCSPVTTKPQASSAIRAPTPDSGFPHKNSIPSRNRALGSSSGKKGSGGFFEKFSGRIRAPEKSGWGTMMEEGFESYTQSQRDISQLNLSEKTITRTPNSSRGRFRSQSREGDSSVRRSLSPTRLAMLGRRNHPDSALQNTPPSINSLLNQSQLSRLQGSLSPARTVAPPRFKTPDELSHKRPTPDNQRRNKVTEAAEWSRMSDWLNSIDMKKYCDNFQRSGVTKLSVVELLQYHDMVQLQIDRLDIPYILERIEEIRRRTKSFTDQAPLQFLPQKNEITPLPLDVIHSQIPPVERSTGPRILLSQRKKLDQSLDVYYLVTPSHADSSKSLVDPQTLLKYLDQSDRVNFLSSWQLVKDFLHSNSSTIATEVIEQIHPLEFLIRLSFVVSSLILPQVESTKDSTMNEFRMYLESLMRNDDPLVGTLLNSRLYAAYGSIILVPNPRSNPAFSHLFEEKWMLEIRKRLGIFLKQLASIPISLSDFEKYSRNSQVDLVRSPTNSETERDIIQVLNTLEASEKLHKVLRENSSQSRSSASQATANATKQYRASVAKEHTPASARHSYPADISSSMDPISSTKQENILLENSHKIPSRSTTSGRRMSAVLGFGAITLDMDNIPDDSSEEIEIPSISETSDSSSESDVDVDRTRNFSSDNDPKSIADEIEQEYDFSQEKRYLSSLRSESNDLTDNTVHLLSSLEDKMDSEDENLHVRVGSVSPKLIKPPTPSNSMPVSTDTSQLLTSSEYLDTSSISTGSQVQTSVDSRVITNEDTSVPSDSTVHTPFDSVAPLIISNEDTPLSSDSRELLTSLRDSPAHTLTDPVVVVSEDSNSQVQFPPVIISNEDTPLSSDSREVLTSLRDSPAHTLTDSVIISNEDTPISCGSQVQMMSDSVLVPNEDTSAPSDSQVPTSFDSVVVVSEDSDSQVQTSFVICDISNEDTPLSSDSTEVLTSLRDSPAHTLTDSVIISNEDTPLSSDSPAQIVSDSMIVPEDCVIPPDVSPTRDTVLAESSDIPPSKPPPESRVDYIQYLKGNFKGLEKTLSQRILDNPVEDVDPSTLEEDIKRNESEVDSESSRGSDMIEEDSDGSVDENHEFCTPLQLQNLTNRGSFVVMTEEEEELARQKSFMSDIRLERNRKGSGTSRLFKAVSTVETSPDTEPTGIDPGGGSMEKRKSNLSDLIEKFNRGKHHRDVEVGWDGWELVGSRWVRKNPISEEELEAAAAFYSNTHRHVVKKKMKRHSSAELSTFVPEDIRLRARSIGPDFWEEPSSLRQLSSDGGDLSVSTSNSAPGDISPLQSRFPFEPSSPLPTPMGSEYDLL